MSDSTTPWTIACQASLSIGFPRQEYWSGLPFPSPGNFPDPGINLWSPALQADSLWTDHQGNRDPKIWQPLPLGEAVEGELLPSIYDRNWAVSAQQKKWWIRKLILPCDLSVISGCINFRNYSPGLSDISNIIYYISVLSKPGLCHYFLKLPNSEIK